MFDTYLQEGDVVYLKSGTLVAVKGARQILTDNSCSPFCPFITDIWVKVGKDYVSRTDMSKERNRIREIIKQAFEYDFIPLDESILDRFLSHQVRSPEKISLYIHPTRYVVSQVETFNKKRTVYCKEMYSDDGQTVYFHQGPSEVRGPLVHNWIHRL